MARIVSLGLKFCIIIFLSATAAPGWAQLRPDIGKRQDSLRTDAAEADPQITPDPSKNNPVVIGGPIVRPDGLKRPALDPRGLMSRSIAPDPSYFASHNPPDMSVISSQSPILSGIRTEDGHAATAPACRQSIDIAYPSIIEIVAPGNAGNLSDATHPFNVVYSRERYIPFGCTFEHELAGFQLDKYTAYAWTVYDKGRRDRAKWQRLIVSDVDLTLTQGSGNTYDTACMDAGYVSDPSFKDTTSYWTEYRSNLGSPRPRLGDIPTGHGDAKALRMFGERPVISNRLSRPLLRGESYRVNLSLKFVSGIDPVRIRVYGSTSTPQAPLATGSNLELLTETANISTELRDWARYDLETFIPGRDVRYLIISIVPAEESDSLARFMAHIDAVGICEASAEDCGSAPALPSGGTITQDQAIAMGGTPTETLTDFGFIGDLYPSADTTSIAWLDQTAASPSGPMTCNSIGGIDFDSVDPPAGFDAAAEADALDELASAEAELEGVTALPIFDPGVQARVAPPPDMGDLVEKGLCSADLDNSLPFGGRDIVYIHGLITSHLKGNYSTPPKYQEKWATDRNAFSENGVYGARLRDSKYWLTHIEDQLGSINDPSNSYLVVKYSTNERLHWGIEAALTQISEAISGSNSDVVLSAAAEDNLKLTGETCFGSKGLVLVSHSTGGLLTSSMLSVSELSRGSGIVRLRYDDVSWLSDMTDVHVSFAGAHGGSPLATAGLIVMTSTQNAWATARAILFPNSGGLQPQTPGLKTVLVDLHPPYARLMWKSRYKSARVPTLLVVGDTPGLGKNIDYQFGQLLSRGFDDGVNSSRSQGALREPIHGAPSYMVQNTLGLWDMGQPFSKAWSMARQGRSYMPSGLRRFFVHAALAPSGMIQTDSIAGSWSSGNKSADNHYPILQSTASHYDVATAYDSNDDYTEVWGNVSNYEEAAVVTSDVYATGTLGTNLIAQTRQTRRQLSIGLHLPCGISHSPWFNISIQWCYFEWIIWRRNYANLDDGVSETDADYVYRYVLRP